MFTGEGNWVAQNVYSTNGIFLNTDRLLLLNKNKLKCFFDSMSPLKNCTTTDDLHNLNIKTSC